MLMFSQKQKGTLVAVLDAIFVDYKKQTLFLELVTVIMYLLNVLGV